jgi:hypothetical protein
MWSSIGKILRNEFKRCLRKRDKVRMLDGEYCFIDELSLGEIAKSRCNLEQFARLRVEAISPFALEDVLYGFFKGESKLTIFITYKHRLAQILTGRHSYILPKFLPELAIGRNVIIARARAEWNGAVKFFSNEGVFKLTDGVVFSANMVEHGLKVRERILRKFSMFLDYGTCFFSILLLIAGAFSVFFSIREPRINGLKQRIDAKKNEVADIVFKHTFLKNVSKFYFRENFCLASLDTVNRVRHDDILFTDVNCDADWKTLKIKGHAKSIGSVTKYCDSLRQCASIGSIETSNIHSSDRRAFFALDIYFK